MTLNNSSIKCLFDEYNEELDSVKLDYDCRLKDENNKILDKDPDVYSDILKKAHILLWSRKTPSGFRLKLRKEGRFLTYYKDGIKYYLSSDCLINLFEKTKLEKFYCLNDYKDYEEFSRYIAAHMVFPAKQINGRMTINAYKGCHLADRLDLTLECIKKYYEKDEKYYPMKDILRDNSAFFDLFSSFEEYIHFFALDDALDEKNNIIHPLYFLNINDCQHYPKTKEEFKKLYLYYKTFVQKRIKRLNREINLAKGF